MREIDEVPELPDFKNLYKIDQDIALEEFKLSNTKLMFYENCSGETRFLFQRMDASLYAAMVSKLSDPLYIHAYEFLKLTLEGTRLIKLDNRKGFENALKIENRLKKGLL